MGCAVGCVVSWDLPEFPVERKMMNTRRRVWITMIYCTKAGRTFARLMKRCNEPDTNMPTGIDPTCLACHVISEKYPEKKTFSKCR